MVIRTFTTGVFATNAYLLTVSDSSEALLIEAPEDSYRQITAALEGTGTRVAAILLTHGHWDHIVDLAAFQRDGAIVHAHADDQHLMEKPELMSATIPPHIPVAPAKSDNYITDCDQLS